MAFFSKMEYPAHPAPALSWVWWVRHGRLFRDAREVGWILGNEVIFSLPDPCRAGKQSPGPEPPHTQASSMFPLPIASLS